jgi:hypothetical protein
MADSRHSRVFRTMHAAVPRRLNRAIRSATAVVGQCPPTSNARQSITTAAFDHESRALSPFACSRRRAVSSFASGISRATHSHTTHRSRPCVAWRRRASSLRSVRRTMANLFDDTHDSLSDDQMRLLVTCMQRADHGNLWARQGSSRLTRETRAFFERRPQPSRQGPTEQYDWQPRSRHRVGRLLIPAEAKPRGPLTTNRAHVHYLLVRSAARTRNVASTPIARRTIAQRTEAAHSPLGDDSARV